MAVMGFEGTLTVAGCSAFRSVKFGISATEVDVTTNADEGEKMYAKGLIDKSITAEMDISDTNAGAVITAAEARTPVTVTASIGSITMSGSYLVFAGEVGGSLDDAVWLSITLRPSKDSVPAT